MTEAVFDRDETLDVLCKDKLRIIQKKNGYRFSIDPILLANFLILKKHERLLDIGSGCGIIPVYLCKKSYGNEMLGIEIQEDLYNVSLKNKTINDCRNVSFMHGDIKVLAQLLKQSPFHVVVSNPPYTKEKGGRKSPQHSRLVARYETFLTLPDLMMTTSSLLFRKGRFYTIYPSRRLGELIGFARLNSLELKRLRPIYPRRDKEANLFLAEFIKEGGIGAKIEQPLYIFGNSGYTDEVKKYYILNG
jgi:tRNA1Val (adenine37-N6)-methyltransferase